MLRIDNLKLPVGVKEDKLRAACAHVLRVSEEALVSVKLLRRSIDAREGVKLLLDIYENYGCVAASGVFVCDKDEVKRVEVRVGDKPGDPKFVITDLNPGTWQIKKDGKVYIPAMEVRSDDGILSFEGTAGHYEFLR